ncbi:MAG: 2-amino-4-hydroxy-6-hydroxymethyldihydropteridine diphosphokinase [Bacteroidales bacterium]|nr:2-amino-4-hydroxy-6-hydroxymethyldihydropteridine diphosphokinase [Bacteroidales bacterium]
MNKVYLLIGSNLGDRLNQLATAREQISATIGHIITESSIFETESWGFKGADFLNKCILVESGLMPQTVLDEIIRIENKMGRKRIGRGYENRPIDIDILFYNDEIIGTTNLVIPQRNLENRRFVLEPLNEIASGLVHPVIKNEIRILLSECKDSSKVVKYPSA